jgi:SWIM/SEC-C metal-binding protein
MTKLGSHKRPAVVRVQSPKRAQEIMEMCEGKGWQIIVGIEPDKFEDVSDVEKLLYPDSSTSFRSVYPKTGRNDFCYCGSGKKYKKCCLAETA